MYRGEDTSHCCRSLARNSEYKFRVSRLKVLTRNSEYKFRVSRTKNKCVVIVAQHFVLSWCHVPIKQSLSLGQVREKCFSSPPTRVFFTRKSARFYAFRYKSTPSTALPSMLARTKICKRTRSDYRLFPLSFTVPLEFFSSSLSLTQPIWHLVLCF